MPQRAALALTLALGLAGCAAVRENGARAARDAFFDGRTLVPFSGAVVLGAAEAVGLEWDEKISHWASHHNPVFGTDQNARHASDWIQAALGVEAATASLLAQPTHESGSKLGGVATEALGWGLTTGLVTGLKHATGRERPDRSDDLSFPSGHAASSASAAAIANRNLNFLPLPPSVRNTAQVTNEVMVAAVGWARVEGRRHHPTDVLVGAALGHFVTAWVQDTFLGDASDRAWFQAGPSPNGKGAMIGVRLSF